MSDRSVAKSWDVGDGVVFDTTFFHSAYNDGDEAADILFIDFFHPELTDAEVTALKCFQRSLRAVGEAAKQKRQRRSLRARLARLVPPVLTRWRRD